MSPSVELPKQELLIKLLGKTTSDNDAEALAFMRKANELLRNAGWTWERLIQGKIRVLEDPFKSIVEPVARKADYRNKAPRQQPASAGAAPHAPVRAQMRTPNWAAKRPRKTTLADLGLD